MNEAYMSESYYEVLPEVHSFGVHVTYNTVPGGYHPLHWHEALEILYPLAIRRIREVLAYTEEHFREPVSLDDMTRLVGLGKESFCRFFKKQMGSSFLNYLTEVRLSHVYRDLVATDETVATVMERNGFTNQKLFNRAFKALYGETPSSVRREYRGRSVT